MALLLLRWLASGLRARRALGAGLSGVALLGALATLVLAAPGHAEPSQAEPSQAEPSQAEPSHAEPGQAAPAAAPPRLVVVIAVDQLRPDRLTAGLPGGLGRLVREGRVYASAVQDHAMTETCPGHVTLLTGRHPGPAGIPGNSFFIGSPRRVVYCADDPTPEAAVLGVEGEGRSPRLLKVEALGDWMRRRDPGSRVFSVGGKDRAAIMMAGQRPDVAYWFRGEETLAFTTSRYYREDLPAWVKRFNGPGPDGFLAAVPSRWEHAVAADGRRDDFPGESDRFSRTSGHPLRSEDRALFSQRLMASPYLDLATLDFARALVAEEGLGADAVPDLLAISLSATDIIGHFYGPFSQESRDALARLDAALGGFLAALEAKAGAGRVLVVLTSDHGVLPLPEWLAEQGRGECPVSGGRIGLKRTGFRLLTQLHFRHARLRWPRSWLLFAGTRMAVDDVLAEGRAVDARAVAKSAEEWLEKHPGIAEVWTAAEVRDGESETARLYRNSWDPERSGDLIVQVEPGCLISPYDTGTTHGTPHLYDRAVPLVFWGGRVEPGRVQGPARTIDIAPTLAGLLGLAPGGASGPEAGAGSPLDGVPLF